MESKEKDLFEVSIAHLVDDGVYVATCAKARGLIIQGDSVEDVISETKLLLPAFFDLDSKLPPANMVEFAFNIDENAVH